MTDKYTKSPTTGLHEKFHVERTDGQSAPGEKHHGCNYFVLDLDHDAWAGPALAAYAKACREACPALADDLEALACVKAFYLSVAIT